MRCGCFRLILMVVICEGDMSEGELTERELLIAKKAAEMAVKQITDEFYRGVGRNVINRWLIIIGAIAVAFATGKGWVAWK